MTGQGSDDAASGAIVLGTPAEEQRRKTVRAAQRHMDAELSKRWKGRRDALASVAIHPRPMQRAKQIVEFEQRRRVYGEPVINVRPPDKPKVRYTKKRLEQIAAGAAPVKDDEPSVRYCWPKDHQDPPNEFADQSDVQELLVRVINAGVRDPRHFQMIDRLAHVVIKGMTMEDFQARAARIINCPPAWQPNVE